MSNTVNCNWCEGTGLFEGACGEVELCASCHGMGLCAVPARSAPVTTSRPYRTGANVDEWFAQIAADAWSPYPWPFGRDRDYYDRSTSNE